MLSRFLVFPMIDDCHYSKMLIEKIEELNLKSSSLVDVELIRKAILAARKSHGDQLRGTGEPYYTHPIAVAFMVADYLFSTEAIIVSLLHDTLEDTDMTYEEIAGEFSTEIADMVLDLTRIRQGVKISAADIVATLWREQKHNLLLIKLIDRLHNMNTLSGKPREKQIKTIQETLQYFLAVAEVLEVPHLSDLLYKLCYENNVNLGVINAVSQEFSAALDLSVLQNVENNSH